jgi:hypothetical protein
LIEPLANGGTWTEISTAELAPQIFQSAFKLLPVLIDDVPHIVLQFGAE